MVNKKELIRGQARFLELLGPPEPELPEPGPPEPGSPEPGPEPPGGPKLPGGPPGDYDVIIVGTGIGGLSCGALLARRPPPGYWSSSSTTK